MKKIIEKIFIEVTGKKIPAKIYQEQRHNVRFSIGKTGAIMRMPLGLKKSQQNDQKEAFKKWVIQQFEKKESLQKYFWGKGYQDGDILKVGRRSYQLKIEYTNNKTHQANLKNNIIHLRLSKHDIEVHVQKSIKHLISRLIAKDFISDIRIRVKEINEKNFQKDIQSVNLKYNLTNWGSCSSRKNINLSTRLLFAPDDVIDYVIIHELAHLVEMNHSPRFWSIVENVMPQYREKERWLKEKGHLYDF